MPFNKIMKTFNCNNYDKPSYRFCDVTLQSMPEFLCMYDLLVLVEMFLFLIIFKMNDHKIGFTLALCVCEV